MNEFVMLFHSPNTPDFKPSAEQMQASMKQWQDWMGGIAAQGKFVSTSRLSPAGKTLSPNKIITDGPFAEVKEIIGGYLVVKTESIDEAMELAQGCPILEVGGKVEVRPIIPM
jgi:hypothetical protein